MQGNKRLYIFIGITLAVGAGFAFYYFNPKEATPAGSDSQNIIRFDEDTPTTKIQPEEPPTKPPLTMLEVEKHDNRDDCWMVIRDKVYDVSVSKFQDHPGGEAIFQGCGLDATVLFETRPMGSGTPHSSLSIEKILPTFFIGNLVK